MHSGNANRKEQRKPAAKSQPAGFNCKPGLHTAAPDGEGNSTQGWPNCAESRSSDSRLGDSAKTSDSRLGDLAIRVTPINPLLTPTWPACAVLRDRSSIFNIPSKHFELVRHHHFAVLLNIDKLLSGCGLQPIEDRRVDMPVSRPVSLARGGRNDLK